jgi:hypothetical protein
MFILKITTYEITLGVESNVIKQDYVIAPTYNDARNIITNHQTENIVNHGFKRKNDNMNFIIFNLDHMVGIEYNIIETVKLC